MRRFPLVLLCSFIPAASVLWAAPAVPAEVAQSSLVTRAAKRHLVYTPWDNHRNIIPDFSRCGYGGGGVDIPEVAVAVTLEPQPGSGDDTPRIQEAINTVAKLAADKAGLRGAVLLKPGTYRCQDNLRIETSGVVLRGSGEKVTIIQASSKSKEPFLSISGSGEAREIASTRQSILEKFVPVGETSVTVAEPMKFAVGEKVFVIRKGNTAWIQELAMDKISQGRGGGTQVAPAWEPAEIVYDRTVRAIEGNLISVDAPIVCAIDELWGGGALAAYEDPGRIEHCGVEALSVISAFDPSNTNYEKDEKIFIDERHNTHLVNFRRVKNAWVRHVTATNFYHGVANVEAGCKWLTLEDCTSLDPVSQVAAGRRNAFYIGGQLTLVRRCKSRGGRPGFGLATRTAGPNAFVDCVSEKDYVENGPLFRWANGVLFDNCKASISIQDRQWMGNGWAGANCVVWNCEGAVVAQQPPTAQNFVIGLVGTKSRGEFDRRSGIWESLGRHVEPRSLYEAQLADRLGR